MRSIMWAYPWDLLGEGLETALGTIKDTARQTGISVAVSYHHGRFLNPQGERPALRFAEGSRVYFQPNLRLYGEIRPNVATLAQTRDPLAETVRAAERAGLAVHAWTVVLHNTSLGTQRPDLCLQTPFGDPLIHSVCPANPSVRAYAQALAHDLAHGRGLAEIELEAVNYLGFGHGYHHEKTGVPLDGWHAFLLGLCFCPHCRAAAKAAGADAARVHRWVTQELRSYFGRDTIPSSADGAESALTRTLVDADFAGYLRSRVQTVVSLVRALRQAAQPVPVSAYLGSGPAGTDGGWASGLVAEALVAAEALDTALVGMYGFSPPEARRAYATARATVQDRAEVGAMLSGIAPDVTTSEEIVGTVRALAEMGLGRVNIYNYGLMRRPVLAALGRALA